MCLSNFSDLLSRFNSQALPSVHVQGPCPLAIAVAFGAILLPVAGLAVDLLVVAGQRGAVQALLADHWHKKRKVSIICPNK